MFFLKCILDSHLGECGYPEPSVELGLETYEWAKAFQANLVWKKLDEINNDGDKFLHLRLAKS